MKIPIHCESCGELMAIFDTTEGTSTEWLDAPCGDKICKECCEECAKSHDPYHACMNRRKAGL